MNPRHLVLETNVLPLNYTPISDATIVTDMTGLFNPLDRRSERDHGIKKL